MTKVNVCSTRTRASAVEPALPHGFVMVTATGVEARRVSVRTVADGLAVVEGLSAGERVRVFGPGEGSPEQGSGSTTGSP